MQVNPFLGLMFHAIGGLAAASFYIPYNKVVKWHWETYWLVGGFFSWIVAPWLLAMVIIPQRPKGTGRTTRLRITAGNTLDGDYVCSKGIGTLQS